MSTRNQWRFLAKISRISFHVHVTKARDAARWQAQSRQTNRDRRTTVTSARRDGTLQKKMTLQAKIKVNIFFASSSCTSLRVHSFLLFILPSRLETGGEYINVI